MVDEAILCSWMRFKHVFIFILYRVAYGAAGSFATSKLQRPQFDPELELLSLSSISMFTQVFFQIFWFPPNYLKKKKKSYSKLLPTCFACGTLEGLVCKGCFCCLAPTIPRTLTKIKQLDE